VLHSVQTLGSVKHLAQFNPAVGVQIQDPLLGAKVNPVLQVSHIPGLVEQDVQPTVSVGLHTHVPVAVRLNPGLH
jgi:hypothetical protein